jgi:hypothetical protein
MGVHWRSATSPIGSNCERRSRAIGRPLLSISQPSLTSASQIAILRYIIRIMLAGPLCCSPRWANVALPQ